MRTIVNGREEVVNKLEEIARTRLGRLGEWAVFEDRGATFVSLAGLTFVLDVGRANHHLVHDPEKPDV